jgi:hypothetical protein
MPERVPKLIAVDDDSLVLCYEHHAMRAADDLVRSAGHISEGDFTAMVDAVRSLSRVFEEWPDPEASRLPVKQRDFASTASVVIPKGADIRNIGVRPDGPALFFDPGKLYVGPREELHAKWLVSVLLLNWGAPASRYARGPDLSLAARFADAIDAQPSREAVIRELRRELRRAIREPLAGTWAKRRAKSAGSVVLGVPYFLSCARWTNRRWPARA